MNDSKDSRRERENQSLPCSSETKQVRVPVEQSPSLHMIRHHADHQPSLQLGSDLRVFVYGQDSAFGRGTAQIRRTFLLLLVTATLCGIVYKFPSIHIALFNVEKNIELTTDLSQLERIRAKYREGPGFSNLVPLLYIQEVRIRSRATLSHLAVIQSLNQKDIVQLTDAISRLSYVETTDKIQNVIGEVVSGLDSLSRRELSELKTMNFVPIFDLWRTVYSASQNVFRETPALQSVNDSLAQSRRRMVLGAMTSPQAGTTTLDLLQELNPELLKGDRLLLDLAGNAVGGQVLRFINACIRNYDTPDPEVRTAMRNVTIFPGQNNDEPITLDRLLLDTRPRLVNSQKISSIHGAVTPSRLAMFRDALSDQSASEVLIILQDLEPRLEHYSYLLDHAYRRFVVVVTDPNTPKLYTPTDGIPSEDRSLYNWFKEGADQRLLKVARAEGRETLYREFAERFLASIDPDRETTKYEDYLAQLMTAVYEPKPDLVRIGTLCDKLNSETFTSTEPGRTFVKLVQKIFIPIATWIQSGNTLPARDQGLLDDAYRELLLFFDSDVSLEESSTSKLSRKSSTKMRYQENNQVFGKLQVTLVTKENLANDRAKFRYNDDSLNETAEWDLKLLRDERPGFVFFLELAFAVWLSEATYSDEPTYPFLEFPKRIINRLDPHEEGVVGTNAIGLKLLSQLSPPNLDTMEEFLTASKAVRRARPGFWPGVPGDRYLFDNYAFARSVVENTEFIKKYGMTPVWHRHILELLENLSQDLKGRVLEGPNSVRDSIKNHAASKILSPEHEAYPLLKLTIAHSLLDSFVTSGPGVFYPSNDRDPNNNLVDPNGDWRKLLNEQEFVKDDIHKANFEEYAVKLGLRDKKGKDRFVPLKKFLIEAMGGETIEYRMEQTVCLWSFLATWYGDAESFFIPGWLMFKTDREQHKKFVGDCRRRHTVR